MAKLQRMLASAAVVLTGDAILLHRPVKPSSITRPRQLCLPQHWSLILSARSAPFSSDIAFGWKGSDVELMHHVGALGVADIDIYDIAEYIKTSVPALFHDVALPPDDVGMIEAVHRSSWFSISGLEEVTEVRRRAMASHPMADVAFGIVYARAIKRSWTSLTSPWGHATKKCSFRNPPCCRMVAPSSHTFSPWKSTT